jgi:hypothetical protein
MTQPTTQELLSEMARLTALSGRISDIQIKNLQTFPLIFFNGIKEIKIDYDLAPVKTMDDSPTFSNSRVSYYLALTEDNNEGLDRRFFALEESVRTLFWKDVTLEVYFNDKIKYKSALNGNK